MKLTRRQETFIRNLMDLSRELQGPIHYSMLAERTGVSRITAYDMLRLLEEKGFVRSDYQLAEGKSGPGRSEIVFWPTERVYQRMAHRNQQIDAGDWEGMKDRMLDQMKEQMQSGQICDEEDYQFATEMLARIPPDGPKPMQYCVEVITIIALRLRNATGRQLFMDYLSTIVPDSGFVSASDLTMLSGFSLGLLVAEQSDEPGWNRELLEHVRQYDKSVAEMDESQRRQLADRLSDVSKLLTEIQTAQPLAKPTSEAIG
jgi:DNA-binding Lrp family transcriptional regulator